VHALQNTLASVHSALVESARCTHGSSTVVLGLERSRGGNALDNAGLRVDARNAVSQPNIGPDLAVDGLQLVQVAHCRALIGDLRRRMRVRLGCIGTACRADQRTFTGLTWHVMERSQYWKHVEACGREQSHYAETPVGSF